MWEKTKQEVTVTAGCNENNWGQLISSLLADIQWLPIGWRAPSSDRSDVSELSTYHLFH